MLWHLYLVLSEHNLTKLKKKGKWQESRICSLYHFLSLFLRLWGASAFKLTAMLGMLVVNLSERGRDDKLNDLLPVL